jgi:hypothetical protein
MHTPPFNAVIYLNSRSNPIMDQFERTPAKNSNLSKVLAANSPARFPMVNERGDVQISSEDRPLARSRRARQRPGIRNERRLARGQEWRVVQKGPTSY